MYAYKIFEVLLRMVERKDVNFDDHMFRAFIDLLGNLAFDLDNE